MYYSTKNYGNDRGLSCCFRQWRSTHSHCSTIHGYSIGIKLIFQSETLDDRNWVYDFGGLKAFKDWADYMFDHTIVVAKDDPHLDVFKSLNEIKGGFEEKGVCDLRIVDGVGCEKFSEIAYNKMVEILESFKLMGSWSLKDQNGVEIKNYRVRYPVGSNVKLKSVEVYEHAGNSAIYEG